MQKKQDHIGLVWFRNDLRVEDNSVLRQALDTHTKVIAVYCFDPRHYAETSYGFKKTEKFRAKFLIETIADLKSNLKTLQVELFVFHDQPETAIPKLVADFNVRDIYFQKEWTQEELEVSEALEHELKNKIEFHSRYDQFLYHPDDINMTVDQIPQVYTNFRKKVEKYSQVRTIGSVEAAQSHDINNTTEIPSLNVLGFEDFKAHSNTAIPFKGGETAAMQRLNDYFFETKKLGVYKKTRNGLIGKDFSSKFSIWLANGSISARTIYWKVKQFEKEAFKNDSTYWLIFELIWRDYFKYISLKHGNNLFKIGGILQKDYDWKTDHKQIEKWMRGDTKSDFVNSNMIELNKTGFMSNRGRQNVASYFAKDLLLDWRIGAAYFESLLVDYDVHSNYGNWMYVAGVGNDPRDRKFNVTFQAERYDAEGKYRRLWLQETLF
ncbi:DASH family cryptochrome [Subsaximicrobium wynnwilliamsii]|uniref:Cryptochrome DASH n=1 Tax=Subsaximicrobium wynnwilliamsii TaxID=291179 RepID=A0A5C6ZCU4_9FLAO|nr:DASH family cryptochrome [Subsaximicrobium wynnwilliamsii]TXD81312.1 DASH family cryptochrome [Subsaximicrobium wynnwilliamsii]TXD87319.1 DASH family cryptochrome [Subsaximicrobium wynnwilliamsii]TXE00924.1 DASH family cryptochrome [Subsaximicrobium wynnwilliamsii]